jgi:hypothetical protein
MVDIAGAVDPVRWPWLLDLAKVERVLAVLALLGLISLTAVGDRPLSQTEFDPPNQGRPFILGVSVLGGPDCLGACIPSLPTK